MAQAATGTATVRTIKRDVPFAWEGRDKRGARIKGKSLAPDEAALRAELRRQGIAPSRIRKQRDSRRGGKVDAGDIAVFSRQLATMLAAGIPMVQAMEIVGAGNEKASMQRLILNVKADVEGGTSLHEALGKHPLYFDDLFVNLVEAGEQAGALESLLDKIATYKEKTEALKKKVKKAFTVPKEPDGNGMISFVEYVFLPVSGLKNEDRKGQFVLAYQTAAVRCGLRRNCRQPGAMFFQFRRRILQRLNIQIAIGAPNATIERQYQQPVRQQLGRRYVLTVRVF